MKAKIVRKFDRRDCKLWTFRQADLREPAVQNAIIDSVLRAANLPFDTRLSQGATADDAETEFTITLA